jgi:hypothetical protein
MLDIQTFDARRGGNVLYKALVHPLAAEAIATLAADIRAQGKLAVFDPDGVAVALWALHPEMPAPSEFYVQDVDALGNSLAGIAARPLIDLPHSACRVLLIASFDSARIEQRIAGFCAPGLRVVSLDQARLPGEMQTTQPYLDRLNFATNYALFRDGEGVSTRLVTANYWARYGAKAVRFWLCLFGGQGEILARWEQALPEGEGGVCIDSREVRARFGLGPFAGQLFLHAIGVAGHDVVKYALDVFSTAADGADPARGRAGSLMGAE